MTLPGYDAKNYLNALAKARLQSRNGGAAPVGSGVNGGLDAQALQDIDFIRRDADIQLAEYAQRMAAENAEAGFQRRQVGRDIGINRNALQGALGRTDTSYADLIVNLGGLIPGTEQAYAEGVEGVGDAYTSGAAALAPDQAAAQLEAQLAALTGGQTDNFAANVNSERTAISDLLTASGAASQANLRTLGEGDVAAARAALPGYTEERDERRSDVQLAADAELSNLQNELAGIHADFVPFNQADLELRTEMAIADAIRQGTERTNRQREEDENYSGHADLLRYARENGQEDLARFLLDADIQARQGQYDEFGELIPYEQYVTNAISEWNGSGEDETERRRVRLRSSNSDPGNVGWVLAAGRGEDDYQEPEDYIEKMLVSRPRVDRNRQRSEQQVLQEMLAILEGRY